MIETLDLIFDILMMCSLIVIMGGILCLLLLGFYKLIKAVYLSNFEE